MSELKLIGLKAEKDKLKVIHGQDIAVILRDNYEARKHTEEVWSQGKDLKQVASIPYVIWLLWESAGITRDPVELLKAIERNSDLKVVDKRLL